MVTSMDASPRLSIGLPVYNGERFLAQALSLSADADFSRLRDHHQRQRLLRQHAADLPAYAQRDRRIRYVRNQLNLGSIANFNRVFELSRAPLFKWTAHDDLHRETYLESCIQLLDDDPDVVLADRNTAFIDENGEFFPSIPKPKAIPTLRPESRRCADAAEMATVLQVSNDSGKCCRKPDGEHTYLV